jgi:hypothetical protein
MRVYLAATRGRLRTLAAGESIDEPWEGFAPLDSVRAELGGAGDEELEYALSVAAGEASAALGTDEGSHGRRFVVVAEVADDAVHPDPDAPGAVLVRAPIALSDVEAILADEPDRADGGYAVMATTDELGWFGVQEIADLLA